MSTLNKQTIDDSISCLVEFPKLLGVRNSIRQEGTKKRRNNPCISDEKCREWKEKKHISYRWNENGLLVHKLKRNSLKTSRDQKKMADRATDSVSRRRRAREADELSRWKTAAN